MVCLDTGLDPVETCELPLPLGGNECAGDMLSGGLLDYTKGSIFGNIIGPKKQ